MNTQKDASLLQLLKLSVKVKPQDYNQVRVLLSKGVQIEEVEKVYKRLSR